MAEYIDKSALVAEIDRRIQFFIEESGNSNSDIVIALYRLKSFIDTLEVKEISDEYNGFLGKELKIVDNEIARLEKLKVKEVDLDDYYHKFLEKEWFGKHYNRTISEMMAFTAKHFFELGIKMQKGE